MKKIREIMNREIPLLRRNTTFPEVLKIFAGSAYSALPVINGEGRLIGTVNLKDVLPNLLLPKEELALLEKLPFFADFFAESDEMIQELKNLLIVSDIMQEDNFTTITEEDSLVKAVILMKEKNLHQIVVTDNENRPTGLVNYNDICRSLL